MQPFPRSGALRQYVCHHLLPFQFEQVRLPPRLALQDLHAQLRGGRASANKLIHHNVLIIQKSEKS